MMRAYVLKRAGRGFTLIELLVVVAIVAMLAALAVSQYSRYAYRARRTDAQNMLMRVATAQERYYATYNKYASSVTSDLKFSTDTTEKGYYKISLAAITDYTTGYTATATAQGAQQRDVCGNLTLTSRGVKGQSGATGTNGNCW